MIAPNVLSAHDIRRLFQLLGEELARDGVHGELYVVGGAVMCLAHNVRPATNDVDGYFVPAQAVREAARRVGEAAGVGPEWLNDGVKAFLAERGDFHPFLELPNLRVLVASPEYLLAMKCLALRIGEEFHDMEDVRFLLRALNVDRYDVALAIIERYYPPSRFPPKALFALRELLPA